jgi:SH3-like domain-containing protein
LNKRIDALRGKSRSGIGRAPHLSGAAILAVALASIFGTAQVRAADGAAEAAAAPRQIVRGEVTNLPLPRFVSLKGREGNARRGPGLDHRIDWVFRHPGLPLMITAEYGNWRRVEDVEGMGGWVHYALLSGERRVIVTAPEAALHSAPRPDAPIVARAEADAILSLDACEIDWCRLSARGVKGWAPRGAFWGVLPDEVID